MDRGGGGGYGDRDRGGERDRNRGARDKDSMLGKRPFDVSYCFCCREACLHMLSPQADKRFASLCVVVVQDRGDRRHSADSGQLHFRMLVTVKKAGSVIGKVRLLFFILVSNVLHKL
jgi:hypothetical protein